MDDGSIRLFNSLDRFLRPPSLSVSVPVDVEVEGGNVPVFAFGKFPTVRFTRKIDGYLTENKLNEASIDVPLLSTGITEYRVSVDNLPEGYSVKSVRYGTSDAAIDTVKLTPPPKTSASYAASVAAYNAGVAAAAQATQNNTENSISPSASET